MEELRVSAYGGNIIVAAEDQEDHLKFEWPVVLRFGIQQRRPILLDPQCGYYWVSEYSWEQIKHSLRENVGAEEAERLIADYESQ